MTEDSRLNKAQRGQKTEIELINKEVWKKRKEKKRCSIEDTDSCLIWNEFNTVAEELVSSKSQNITTGY